MSNLKFRGHLRDRSGKPMLGRIFAYVPTDEPDGYFAVHGSGPGAAAVPFASHGSPWRYTRRDAVAIASTTSGDGVFEFPGGLPAGRYRFHVHPKALYGLDPAWTTELDLREAQEDIDLRVPLTLGGVVIVPGEQPGDGLSPDWRLIFEDFLMVEEPEDTRHHFVGLGCDEARFRRMLEASKARGHTHTFFAVYYDRAEASHAKVPPYDCLQNPDLMVKALRIAREMGLHTGIFWDNDDWGPQNEAERLAKFPHRAPSKMVEHYARLAPQFIAEGCKIHCAGLEWREYRPDLEDRKRLAKALKAAIGSDCMLASHNKSWKQLDTKVDWKDFEDIREFDVLLYQPGNDWATRAQIKARYDQLVPKFAPRKVVDWEHTFKGTRAQALDRATGAREAGVYGFGNGGKREWVVKDAPPGPGPGPGPTPTPGTEPIDLSKVKWIDRDVSGWKRSAVLKPLNVQGAVTKFDFDKLRVWKEGPKEGSKPGVSWVIWEFVRIGDTWHAGTVELGRFGIGDDRKTEIFSQPARFQAGDAKKWKGQHGELVYVMVSTLIRMGVPLPHNGEERSNLVELRLP